MPGASPARERLLLHPVHGGTARAVPTCVTEGLGRGGGWSRVVNKGLFSPEGESGVGELEDRWVFGGRPMNPRDSAATYGGYSTPPRGTAVWARGMAQGPGMGPGDSSVPRQGTARRWDALSHSGTMEGVSWVGDHHLVPMVGAFPLGFIQPLWPNLGVMVRDRGPVEKESVMLTWGFQDINW